MLSPKVLDRANVIEFRMNSQDLANYLKVAVKPDLAKLDGGGVAFASAFVDAAISLVLVPQVVKPLFDSELRLLFDLMQIYGVEFGYRTAYEAARFMAFNMLLGNHSDVNPEWFQKAFDCVILQKLLPKLHGSRSKLGPILKMLWFLCVTIPGNRGADALNAAVEASRSSAVSNEPSAELPTDSPYPLSAEKIYRMWRLLSENGFSSFAEA